MREITARLVILAVLLLTAANWFVFRDNNGTHCFGVREPCSRFCDFVDLCQP